MLNRYQKPNKVTSSNDSISYGTYSPYNIKGYLTTTPAPNITQFTHVFDFTASDGGFTAVDNLGDYVAATGWQSILIDPDPDDPDDDYQEIHIELTGFNPTVLKAVRLHFTWDLAPTDVVGEIVIAALPPFDFDTEDASPWRALIYADGTTSLSFHITNQITPDIGLAVVTLTQVVISGLGADPF